MVMMGNIYYEEGALNHKMSSVKMGCVINTCTVYV